VKLERRVSNTGRVFVDGTAYTSPELQRHCGQMVTLDYGGEPNPPELLVTYADGTKDPVWPLKVDLLTRGPNGSAA